MPTPARLNALLVLLAVASSAVAAAEPALHWRVCISDLSVPPFLLNDPPRLGSAERLLLEAGREAGLAVELLRYPPKRCRALLENGQLEAMIAGPTRQNLVDYAFPLKPDGSVDAGRRLFRVDAVWVRRAEDTAIEWNGSSLSGVPPGITLSVAVRRDVRLLQEPLKALGLRIDEDASTTRQMLMKVAARRVDLAVASRQDVEALLRGPLAVPGVVVLGRPLLTQDVYVVGAGPQRQASRFDAWWNAIGRLRAQREAASAAP